MQEAKGRKPKVVLRPRRSNQRKRLTRAVVDLSGREGRCRVSVLILYEHPRSIDELGLGRKAHRFAAASHGSNSSTRLFEILRSVPYVMRGTARRGRNL